MLKSVWRVWIFYATQLSWKSALNLWSLEALHIEKSVIWKNKALVYYIITYDFVESGRVDARTENTQTVVWWVPSALNVFHRGTVILLLANDVF